MRYLSAAFIFFLLFWFMKQNDARKEDEEYWKSMMNGEPMPKAIKDFLLVDQDPTATDDHSSINMGRHFVKDFGTKPNLIIYHSHVDTQVAQEFGKEEDIKKINLKNVKPNVPEV